MDLKINKYIAMNIDVKKRYWPGLLFRQYLDKKTHITSHHV